MQGQPDITKLLPLALTQSADYEALTDRQREGLTARLLHAYELVDGSLRSVNVAGDAQRQAVSDLELDAMAVIGIGGDPEKTVSAWKVHSSWTFECSEHRLADYIDSSVLTATVAPQMNVHTFPVDVSHWLRRWSVALQSTFKKLSTAKRFCEAVAQLIAIDLLIAALLTTIALLHVSGYLNRQ